MTFRRMNIFAVAGVAISLVLGGLYTHPLFAQDCPELVGQWPYGANYAITVSGDYAYFGNGRALMIADVSNQATPEIVGEVVLPDTPGGIVVSDGYAFVANDESGLRVIDISTPATPSEVAFIDTPGHAGGIALFKDFVYVADGFGGLRVIDISRPTSPTEVGFLETPGWATDVAISDGFAYVSNGTEGLRVIDISTPISPTEVGFLETLGRAYGVTVTKGFAFVADGDGGLRVIDISMPTSPTEIGYSETPGSAIFCAVSGAFVYVADRTGGLRVIDISLPSTPTEVGFFDTPGSARRVALSGAFAYVADGSGGLRVIDIGLPSTPTEVGFIDTADYAVGIAVSEGHAFVADSFAGLRVIDISAPASPSEIAFYDTPGRAFGVAVSDGFAYVADLDEGLRVIDISAPASPSEVGFCDTPGRAFGVAVSDGFAYVADYDEGLRVIDISTPASPSEVGFYDTPGNPYNVAISESFAYVADRSGGLRVIDISSPASPTEVGFFDTPNRATGVAVSEGYAYVADDFIGVWVLDISTPASPVEIGFFGTPGYAYDVAVSGGYAYVADMYEGLRVIDVSSPTSPTEVGFFDTPGASQGVAVSSGLVFVADSASGMAVFRKCASECTPINVAAAASGPGAGDSLWATDLGINNSGAEILTCKFQLLPRGEDNTDAPFTEEFTIQPNSNANFVDIWRLYSGGDGAGSINVCVNDPDAAGVVSRTYNTSDAGTFGQTIVGIKGMTAKNWIATGQIARLGFLTQNGGFRTNVGFVNAGATTISINTEFFTSDGSSLGTKEINIPPFSNNQWHQAFRKVTPENVNLGYIDVWSDTEGAEFLTYASVVDNNTDDPTTIWPFDTSTMVDGETFDCTPIWIAAAASANGAGDTIWATDLGLNNLGAQNLTYRFQFLPRGEDNTGATMSDPFILGGNQAIAYSDIWNEIGGDQGSGSINVCVDNGDTAGIVSRTYNTGDEGTFGQTIVGKRGTAPAKVNTGEKVRLGYLFENDTLRTNIGFMNAGGNQIRINAEFFDMQGNSLGTKQTTLAPYSSGQWNNAYTLNPISTIGITAGFVDVWTDTAHAAFLTYASIVDNGTGDPTTVWPF